MNPHPREIELRRLHAGESLAELGAHVAACADCRAKLSRFDDEQRRFEAAIPFERFAAGVERASRQPRAAPRSIRPLQRLVAIAATFALLVGGSVAVLSGEQAGNRTKGGSGLEVVVAGNGPQRQASVDPLVPEALAPGERVQLGFRAGDNHYLTAVSIDERGEITPLYSQEVTGAATTQYLPDSLVFTGAGLERVVVVMSREKLDVEEVKRAAKARYDEARGNLEHLGTLDLPGEQFHRSFLKP